MREITLEELKKKLNRQILGLRALSAEIATLKQEVVLVRSKKKLLLAPDTSSSRYMREAASTIKTLAASAFKTEEALRESQRQEKEQQERRLRLITEEEDEKNIALSVMESSYKRDLDIVARSMRSYLMEGRLVTSISGLVEGLDSECFDIKTLSDAAWGVELYGLKQQIAAFPPSDRRSLSSYLPSERPASHHKAHGLAHSLATRPIATATMPLSSTALPASASTAVSVLASGTSLFSHQAGLSVSGSMSAEGSKEDVWQAERTQITKMLDELKNECHIPWLFNVRRRAKTEFLSTLQSKLNGEVRGELLKRDLGDFISREMQSERGSLIKAGIFSRRTASFIESLEQKAATLPAKV